MNTCKMFNKFLIIFLFNFIREEPTVKLRYVNESLAEGRNI